MNRRGATLMEVLVAIFIMAIGMMALLVLFPIGALSMAQAIQDERCGQAAANAADKAIRATAGESIIQHEVAPLIARRGAVVRAIAFRCYDAGWCISVAAKRCLLSGKILASLKSTHSL